MSETSVFVYETAERSVPDSCQLHTTTRESLKSPELTNAVLDDVKPNNMVLTPSKNGKQQKMAQNVLERL
jgi:hypothetical protein